MIVLVLLRAVLWADKREQTTVLVKADQKVRMLVLLRAGLWEDKADQKVRMLVLVRAGL